MIDGEERRKVAARLRSMKPEETTAPFGKPVLMHIFRSVFPGQMPLTNWILRLPYQLADLIDRPTCEMKDVAGERYARCARCGAFVRRDAVTDCTGGVPVKFCPNCGAEVVERC